ncbi:thiol reductant ABC exporter subunit CydD [Microbacteriaceae bacterium VKM Ac-2855]|nr:thiol reductant ABC exporter subunit CydD [Microbacteriaceae bacterium VKM Ac-2855]
MKPLDPRLLRYARASRSFLALGAVITVGQTAATVGFAWSVADIVVRCIAGEDPATIAPSLGLLLAIVIVRAVLTWAAEVNAVRGGVRVKAQLRAQAAAAIGRLGPAWLSGRSSGALITLLGTGLDALDSYFARYLPQLIATAVATPVLVLVVLLADPLSAIFVIVTLPLIPVFMVLIGWATQAVQKQQWKRLSALASGFVDTVGGLATLKIFGRAERQGDRIRAVTEEYRVHTMKVLRVTFLSGFVLELAASLSVALVAVSIGLRLVDGSLDLFIGLFVLILAPDVFLPVRQVGAQFHAAADGVAAADEVFAVLEAAGERRPADSVGTDVVSLELAGLAVDYNGVPALAPVDACFAPGTVTAVVGPSGAGKSSLLAALLGFVPFRGAIALNGVVLAERAPRDWVAWSGQQPSLSAGTVGSNVALGASTPDAARVARALSLAAVTIDPATPVGAGGVGLSGGQAARVALARAIHRALERGCGVIALDEPTAALDAETEVAVLAGLRTLAEEGRTVIVVTHRAAVVDAADRVLALAPAAAVPA